MKPYRYLDKLKKVLSQLEITLPIEVTKQFAKIGGIIFPYGSYIQNEDTQNIGFFVPAKSPDRKVNLRQDGKSYLDDKGEILLNWGTHILHLKPQAKIRKSVTVPKYELHNSIAPSLLLSPNAIAIVETLLRVRSQKLQEYKSAFHFCREWDLYQPKISEIMRKLNAKDLILLRSKILSLSIDWWLNAFEAAYLRRQLSSFYLEAQPFYSLINADEKKSSLIFLQDFNFDISQVVHGPTEVAKQLGFLIEQNVNLWISPLAINEIKKKKKLVPGVEKGRRTWFIAVPSKGLHREELLSRTANRNESVALPQIKNNIIRAAWDLTYSDSRTREVRRYLLQSLFDAVQ